MIRVCAIACLIWASWVNAEGLKPSGATYGENVSILVAEDLLANYQRFTQGRDIHSITEFTHPLARRSVTELILLQQALREGGFEQPLVLSPIGAADSARAADLMYRQQHLMEAASHWLSDLAQRNDRAGLLIGSALINSGEYQVGLYVRPHAPILSTFTVESLSEMKSVTHRQWHQDRQALESLGLKEVYLTHDHQLMLKMVYSGRADFMLSSFRNSDDLSYFDGDFQLVPIPGVKVVFHDSRHWVINRQHPHAVAAQQALEQGVAGFRQTGYIHKAMTESGFFELRVANWQVLNKQ